MVKVAFTKPWPESQFQEALHGNKDEQTAAYYDLLERYRHIERMAAGPIVAYHMEPEDAVVYDVLKNRIHRQLKEIGAHLGINASKLFEEIHGWGDASAYGAPEIKIFSRQELYSNRYPGDDEDERSIHSESQTLPTGERADVQRDLQTGQLALLFGKKVAAAVRLPDPRIISTRGLLVEMPIPGDMERIRRAFAFAQKYGYPILHYNAFAHEHSEDLYGIVVTEDSFNEALARLRSDREHFGIREEDLPRAEIMELFERERNKAKQELLRRTHLPQALLLALYDHEWKKIYGSDLDREYETNLQFLKRLKRQGISCPEMEAVMRELKKRERIIQKREQERLRREASEKKKGMGTIR
ncbi:MAG: hypothetical protein Q7R83_04415 [bacterium]|nr:hypothetical protein [bacterium]